MAEAPVNERPCHTINANAARPTSSAGGVISFGMRGRSFAYRPITAKNSLRPAFGAGDQRLDGALVGKIHSLTVSFQQLVHFLIPLCGRRFIHLRFEHGHHRLV